MRLTDKTSTRLTWRAVGALIVVALGISLSAAILVLSIGDPLAPEMQRDRIIQSWGGER